MNAKQCHVSLALILGLLCLAGIMLLLGAPGGGLPVARALGDTHYVAPGGADAGDCTNPAAPCRTVQYAVDQAGESDVIRVAQGTYSGLHARSGVTQVVYIAASLTLQGGYTTTDNFAGPPDPQAYPTVLDAQGLGRAVYISREVTVTLDGLHIVNGAGDKGGEVTGVPLGSGGGILSEARALTVTHCAIVSNTAHSAVSRSVSEGGGIFQSGGTLAVENSRIVSNSADYDGGGIYVDGSAVLQNVEVAGNRSGENGGGVSTWYGSLTIRDSDFTDNTAWDEDPYDSNHGGGVHARGGGVTILEGNTFVSNTAVGFAGGVYVRETTLTMTDNLIQDNVSWSGGGADVYECTAYLADNTFEHNTAEASGGGLAATWGDLVLTRNNFLTNTGGTHGGGGFYNGGIAAGHTYTVTHNLFQGNVGDWSGSTSGGGVRMSGGGWIVFSHNQVLNNTASAGPTGANGGRGGGASIAGPALIADNLFQGNWASSAPSQGGYYYGGYGGGLYLAGQGLQVERNRFLENRAARNAGVNYTAEAFGGGVFVAPYAIVTMTNNIVAGNRHCEECTVLSGSYRGGGAIAIGGQTTPAETQLYLYHNTIADNQSPALLNESAAIAMSHNILAGHATDLRTFQDTSGLGPPPATAADYTLWHPAMSVEIISGTFTHTHDFTGDPAFVSTPLDDYHLGADSEAINRGPGVGVTHDIDGNPRPVDAGYDLGADEYVGVDLAPSTKSAHPRDATIGEPVTFTIVLRNSGTANSPNTVLFDAIPDGTTYVPGSAQASAGVVTDNGAIGWTGTVVPLTPITISFRVTVNVAAVIQNTAIITDGYGMVWYRQAWVNANRLYLPLVQR